MKEVAVARETDTVNVMRNIILWETQFYNTLIEKHKFYKNYLGELTVYMKEVAWAVARETATVNVNTYKKCYYIYLLLLLTAMKFTCGFLIWSWVV